MDHLRFCVLRFSCFLAVHCCLVVTCWEKADLLALVGDVYCIFVTFPFVILGQVWYLIVLFPDLCRLSYLDKFSNKKPDKKACFFVVYTTSIKSAD